MDPMLWWRSYQNSWEVVVNKRDQRDAAIPTNVMLGFSSGLIAEETTEEIISVESLLEEEDNLRIKYSDAPPPPSSVFILLITVV